MSHEPGHGSTPITQKGNVGRYKVNLGGISGGKKKYFTTRQTEGFPGKTIFRSDGTKAGYALSTRDGGNSEQNRLWKIINDRNQAVPQKGSHDYRDPITGETAQETKDRLGIIDKSADEISKSKAPSGIIRHDPKAVTMQKVVNKANAIDKDVLGDDVTGGKFVPGAGGGTVPRF
tara:strand:+ start:463 stop:987 length:525 start_codon:yes stop_codon:yes gene_type:complete